MSMTKLSKLKNHNLRRYEGDRYGKTQTLMSYRADCDCMKPQDLKCVFKLLEHQ